MTRGGYFYHLVWATKSRKPFITADIEPFLYRMMRVKAKELEGHAFAVNGMPDHIHIAAMIPPKCSVAHFVNILKGSTSRFVSLEYHIEFKWQEGYSGDTVSKSTFKYAVAYVERQKEHHANGTTYRHLEETSDDNEPDTGSP